MQLTILGASAATQNPGGACSSYLFSHDSTAIVVDLGSGAFANLQRHIAPDAADAIVVSHMHADHILDLMSYRYWLAFAEASRRPPLYLPPGGHALLLTLSALQDPSPDFFRRVFEVIEYDPTAHLAIGAFSLSFSPMKHVAHTYGMRIAAGDAICAYSADTGPCESVAPLAKGADIFLCENANGADDDFPMHLKPVQAGEYAEAAGVGSLVLTHRWHELGFEAARREAAAVYSGPISMAREGDSYAVGS